jgi:N-acetylmuramoyl-L-alanine amidase
MKIVVINPGHYPGEDPGVCFGDIYEANVNEALSFQLSEDLIRRGYTVVIVQRNDLEAIVDLANGFEADIFVSVHCNGAENHFANGFEIYHDADSSRGRQLAESIHDAYMGEMASEQTDRGIKTKSLYVVSRTAMPAVLIEYGFITHDGRDEDQLPLMGHPSDRDMLLDPEYQKKAARLVADGIDRYFA